MGNYLKLISGALGACLLAATFNSGAMTLGRIRGTALIGQPLDLSIAVQFDAEENTSSQCMEADVFHADTRQDPSRVKVSVESTQQPQAATVRILSSQLVDEPIVTIYLKAGCAQKITRRYVLLADFSSEQVAAPAVPPIANVMPSPAVLATTETPLRFAGLEASKSAIPAARSKEGVVAKPADRKVKPQVAASVKAAEAPPPKAAAVEKRKVGRAAGQSRLRLDPLEVLADRVTTLESAKVTASTSVPSEDVVKDTMRFQSLESDVKALLALAAKNETNLMEMQLRLQKAESERFANWLVYALAAAVLLCLSAVLVLWSRQKKVQAGKGDWWRGGDAATERVNISPPQQVAVTPVAPEATAAKLDIFDRAARAVGAAGAPPPPREHAPVSTVDLHLSEVSASTFDTLLQSGHESTRGGKPDGLSRASGPGSRHINSDELFDIRQQAEFFVSLGQTDQAIRVLERHIAENAASSPSLYLELVRLFHSLNLKTDYRQFREDFNLLFNSRIPDFAMFGQEGRGLEAYPDVLADISALWTSPQVLKLLDACIFQNAWDINGQTFDLAAFRELLLLYAVAQREHEGPGLASGRVNQQELTRMPPVKQVSRSEFGGLTADSVEKTNSQFGQETSLDAYLTSSEPLPSIYGDVDIDLDIDVDLIHSTTNQSKKQLV